MVVFADLIVLFVYNKYRFFSPLDGRKHFLRFSLLVIESLFLQ